ncbi:MAG: hypothetical protein CMJ58_26360 [Planctomycetaceae bacterium]|nr:hypothetical protein [Planctomycetaceae bacterium]
MPTFRERPVTWLFVAASAAVAAVAAVFGASTHGHSSTVHHILAGIIVGEVFFAGAYLSVGTMHRLARAGTFIVAVCVFTSTIQLIVNGQIDSGEWPRVLAAVAMTAIAAAIGATFAGLLVGYFRTRRAKAPRFPVIEMFGWTIVVAAAAVAARFGRFAELLQSDEAATWIGYSVYAGAALALALRGFQATQARRFGKPLLAIAGLLLAIGFASVTLKLFHERLHEQSTLAAALAYAGVCVACLMAETAPTRTETAEPASTATAQVHCGDAP